MASQRTVQINDHKIFYREAGPRSAPAILLLHGFPSSSHMFRELMPRLADSFRVVAPDMPGFGFSEGPDSAHFSYTFSALTNVVDQFTEAVGLESYALYVFDYGAPVGFRLAVAHPERIVAIVSQNGNAYLEGLSANWNPIQKYWSDPSSTNRAALRT